MVRLSRAETQQVNREKVLAAARAEFAGRGFRDAKIDAIAERAELTRGAVYSNFPGKRALYFSVLADLAERAVVAPHAEPGLTPAEALGALARTWVARLPLADTDERDGHARLGMELAAEVVVDDQLRRSYTQLMRLNAILLGLALEALRPGRRQVRIAEAALTTLQGASHLAGVAPGFVEPFNVVRACERLAELDPGDGWPPRPIVPPGVPVDRPWAPPPAFDLLRREPVEIAGDGVVAVLGTHRIAEIEDAVRAAGGAPVTAVLVTSDPAELSPLSRLTIAEFGVGLREAFPESAWPRLRVVFDDTGALAAAAGVPSVSDGTEVVVRVAQGRVVLQAEGYGAGDVVAQAALPVPQEHRQA